MNDQPPGPLPPILGAVSAWISTVISFLADKGLSVCCGVLAVVASIYAIRVSHLTIKLRRLEIDRLAAKPPTNPEK